MLRLTINSHSNTHARLYAVLDSHNLPSAHFRSRARLLLECSHCCHLRHFFWFVGFPFLYLLPRSLGDGPINILRDPLATFPRFRTLTQCQVLAGPADVFRLRALHRAH